jgi:hypothetical protein
MIANLFKLACQKAGMTRCPDLSTASFRRPGAQKLLFD